MRAGSRARLPSCSSRAQPCPASLSRTSLKVWLQPGPVGAHLLVRLVLGADPTPSFHSPSVWAVLPPPSSSALVLADHVPLSLCQGQKTGWGFCLLLLYRWLGEGSRVSLLLGKTSIQA